MWILYQSYKRDQQICSLVNRQINQICESLPPANLLTDFLVDLLAKRWDILKQSSHWEIAATYLLWCKTAWTQPVKTSKQIELVNKMCFGKEALVQYLLQVLSALWFLYALWCANWLHDQLLFWDLATWNSSMQTLRNKSNTIHKVVHTIHNSPNHVPLIVFVKYKQLIA